MQHYKEILETLDDLVIEINDELTVMNVWGGPDACPMGSKADLKNKRLSDIFQAGIAKAYESKIQSVLSSGKLEELQHELLVEEEYRSYHGRIRKIEAEDGVRIILLLRDITDQAHESYYLEEIQRVAKIGGWHVNIQTNVCRWSKGTYAIHDVDYGTHETVDTGINFYLEEDQPRIEEYLKNCIEEKKGFDDKFRIRTAKGEIRWVRAIGEPIVADEKVIALHGTFQDVTEECERQQEVQNSQLRMQLLYQAGKVGSWQWHLDTNEVFYDEGWGALLGLEKEDLIPNFDFFEQLVHPEDFSGVAQKANAYVSGEASDYNVTFRMRHLDGHWVWIYASGEITKRSPDGKPLLFSGTHTDITEIKESARESEIFYKLSSEMSLGLYIYHLENFKDPSSLKMIWANRASQEFTDLDPKEIVGKRFREIFVESDLDLEFIRSIKENVRIDLGQIVYHMPSREMPNTYKVRCFPVDQEFVAVVFEDITEEVRRESELEKQRIIAMNASRLASLGEMSGGIAHEVNNPLAIIQGFASQLKRKSQMGKLQPEDVERMSDIIHKTTERIAKIVRGLRNFAREGSNDPFSPRPVQSLIDDCVGLCGERFKNHQVELRIPKVDPNLIVECRAVEIGQILINLLNNSFDAVKTTEQAEKWIALEVESNEERLKISVLDNGPGISLELRDRVMQPFFTTKEIGKGTGLGLSISKGIIDKHAGEFYIDPDYIDGACFVVELPLKQKSCDPKDDNEDNGSGVGGINGSEGDSGQGNEQEPSEAPAAASSRATL